MVFLHGMFFGFVSFKYLQGFLDSINSKGLGQKVLTVFTVPAIALVGFNGWTIDDILDGVEWWCVTDHKAPVYSKAVVTRPATLNGYTPVNQKLKTYPFMYLAFNPPNGTSKIFRYEDFSGNPTFRLYSEINQNPNVCLVPQNYKGGGTNSVQDMVSLAGYPTLGWITDYFNTWLAQNSEIVSLQMQQEQFNYEIDAYRMGVNAAGSMVGNAITGNAVGALTDGANTGLNTLSLDTNHEYYIKNQLAQIEKQSLLPDNATQSSNNATLLGYNLMNSNLFASYTIKAQFARRIDDYFSMYGYVTNSVKVPNLNNRPNWNYVKTIGANIIANIPQLDLQTLKNMFDNGITLWHNPSTFLDYSQNNR